MRSSLTILTYALVHRPVRFAHTWWQFMLFRFIAALGIGGEWAVGASLLSETWPKAWRPWIAAMLQTGVNLGILLAALTAVLSLVLPPHASATSSSSACCRRCSCSGSAGTCPSPRRGTRPSARREATRPRARDLFRGDVARITAAHDAACALGLSAWWLFQFWQSQHLRRLLVIAGTPPGEVTRIVSASFFVVNAAAIVGNFSAGGLARSLGNRRAIVVFLAGLGLAMHRGVHRAAEHQLARVVLVPARGLLLGVFALFTMYLPPLFPTLLRTTGAGFCYNIGRVAAAVCTIVFGLLAPVNDYREALL